MISTLSGFPGTHLLINRKPGVGGNVVNYESTFRGYNNLALNYEEPLLHRIILVSAPLRKETKGSGLILRDTSRYNVFHWPYKNHLPLTAYKLAFIRNRVLSIQKRTETVCQATKKGKQAGG